MRYSSFDTFASVFEKRDLDSTSYQNRFYTDDFVSTLPNEYDTYLDLKRIKSNSAGPDHIPGFIYRKFALWLALPLSLIFNKCMISAKMPTLWKNVLIVPIPKNKHQFRPISLLCAPSKILEKMMLAKMTPYLIRKMGLNQFAFIPGKHLGTTNALLQIKIWALNRLCTHGGLVRCAMVDFTKAFDKVSQSILLRHAKEKFQFDDHIMCFLENYLETRTQRLINCNVDTSVLQWIPLTSGIPQGSVLGPVLFAMLVNSISVTSERSILVKYADDITLLHHVMKDSVDQFQLELDNINSWSLLNKMKINASKSHYMIFSLNDVIAAETFHINGEILPRCDSVRLLGVVFSTTLKPDLHLQSVYQRCCQGMASIRKLHAHGVSRRLIWKVYLAIVFSHIAYAWPVICETTQSSLKKFETLERQAMSICEITGPISNLRNRLDHICIRLMRKISTNHVHPLRNLFVLRSLTSYNLRNSHSLLPMHNKSTRLLKTFVKFYKNS